MLLRMLLNRLSNDSFDKVDCCFDIVAGVDGP